MFTLLRHWYLRHFSQPGTIEFALVLICAFIIVYYFMWLLGPLVVALCLAFCLDWPVEALQRAIKIKRHLASILVMILFCSCVIFIMVLIVPNVMKQGAEFYNSIVAFSLENSSSNKAATSSSSASSPSSSAADSSSTDANAASSSATEKSSGFGITQSSKSNSSLNGANNDNADSSDSFTDANTHYWQHQQLKFLNQSPDDKQDHNVDFIFNTDPLNLNPSGGDGTFRLTVSDFDHGIAVEIFHIVNNLPEPIPSTVTLPMVEDYVQLGRVAATNKIADLMRTQFMPSVVNAFTWLVYIIIVPIFTLLMLYDKPALQHRAATFLLPSNQVLIKEFWPSLQGQIAGYIRGKILHIIIISIANSLAFMIMGVNYAMLLGVGVGLSVVIPYVGAVIIAIPVILVAIFQFGFGVPLLWVLGVYTAIQLLDSNVLTPMLFSKAMNLDAFSILAAILIFGNLWGFWGVFFAIPLATFIKTLIVRWPTTDLRQIRKKELRLFRRKQINKLIKAGKALSKDLEYDIDLSGGPHAQQDSQEKKDEQKPIERI